MERTNRPTQVGTRAQAGRQPRGAGQTGGGQDGQWVDGLVREYDNKISGQNPAAYGDGRRQEDETVIPGGSWKDRGQTGMGGPAGQTAGDRSMGSVPQGTARQQGLRLSGERQPDGIVGGNRTGGQGYGGNEYRGNGFRQGQQIFKADENRRRESADGRRQLPGAGHPPDNSQNSRPEPAFQAQGNRQAQGGYRENTVGYGARQPGQGYGYGRLPQNGQAGAAGTQAPRSNTGSSKRQQGAGAAGSSKRQQGAGATGSSKRPQGAGAAGGRGGSLGTAKGNGRRPGGAASGGEDRRPPGAPAGRKARRSGEKSRKDRMAEARDRTGRKLYEDAGERRRDVQSRNAEAGGRQSQEQRAKPPGYDAKARKKPGSSANFLVQGSILAAAGIVVRLIGMVYRIPLARKIGDVGNGYYNAAYSIYSILLIMSSYSLPTAVSKMVSARLAKGQYRTSTKIFRASMFYATLAGLAGFCALWFGADYFASEIIKMPYSSYALRCLAPTIWIMAYLGVLRGYFQGHSTMIPTAVSQIFEQVVNAAVSIVAASVLFDMGIKSNLVFHDTEYSYAFGAAGGAIGTGAGALTALVLFLMLTMGYVPTMRKQAKRDRGGRVESYGAISGALFATIVPIIISSAIYNVSNVVDNSIFGHVMEGLGESGQTASQWGVYMGRYHMLFNIPVAIANSLSSSLIPSLSRAAAEKNRREILSKIGSAIRFSMIIAIPSAVGLTVLAEPVSNLLFFGMDNEMLVQMMAVGSSAVVVFSLSTVSNAILQGINRMQVPIINSAVSLGIHVGALYVMLKVFGMGIYSVVYANILFAALVCVLNAISIARYTRYRQEIIKTFLVPCGASAAMGGAAWGIYRLCVKAAGNAVSTAAAILVAILVYFVLLIKLKGVDAKELRGMPGGTRLLGVARKLRLMQ